MDMTKAMRRMLPGVAGLTLAAAAWAQGGSVVGDETVVASFNPPPVGLSCVDAAAQTSVYFNFVHPQFQINQLSLYLDGAGVPANAVDEQWPTITLKSGLHPGTNTVDVVASGAAGQSLDRRLVVQVGNGGGTSASVACDDSAPAQAGDGSGQPPPDGSAYPADASAAPPPDAGAPPPGADAPPPMYTDTPEAYDDSGAGPAPAYAYYADPPVVLAAWVPIIPFYSFNYFYYHYHPHYSPAPWDHGQYHGAYGGGNNEWRPVRPGPPAVSRPPAYVTGGGFAHPPAPAAPAYHPAAPRPSYQPPAPRPAPAPAYRPAPPPPAARAPVQQAAPAARSSGGGSHPPSRGGERGR